LRKELALPYSIVSFENLGELLSTMEEYLDLHVKASEKYGDRLGYLLRRSNAGLSSSSTSSISGADGALGASGQSAVMEGDQQQQDAFDPRTRRQQQQQQQQLQFQLQQQQQQQQQVREGDWVVLGNEDLAIKVATGTGDALKSSEVSVLFKLVEQLKARIANLKVAQRLLAELPSQGFRPDQRLFVVFKDGLPRQVIPTNEMSGQQRRFRYAEQFQIAVLK
jgi:hypothetical protein